MMWRFMVLTMASGLAIKGEDNKLLQTSGGRHRTCAGGTMDDGCDWFRLFANIRHRKQIIAVWNKPPPVIA